MKGVFVGGAVDCEEGILTFIVFPTLTKAYIAVINETTMEEQTDLIKRMSDSNNYFRPAGDILAMATGQSMEDHDMQIIRQLITGAFSTTPLKKLNQKVVKVGITNWLALGVDDTKLASDNLDCKQAREAQQEKKGEMSVELMAPDIMTGLDQVLSMLYNFSGYSDALWISDQEKSKKPILTKGSCLFFH